MSKRNGYSLMELLVTISILGLIATVAIPNFTKMRRRIALRAAASELRSIFHLARMEAIARNRNCGLKFSRTAGVWVFTMYVDGDGDGVRNDDIASGADRPVGPSRVVFPESPIVTIGLLDVPVKDPDGDLVKSPVAFNASSICAFSPYGESTPGTIYITDGDGDLWCVRVFGASAKVRTLRYDRDRRRWLS